MTPLAEWIEATQAYFKRGEAWAVNAFAERRVPLAD